MKLLHTCYNSFTAHFLQSSLRRASWASLLCCEAGQMECLECCRKGPCMHMQQNLHTCSPAKSAPALASLLKSQSR